MDVFNSGNESPNLSRDVTRLVGIVEHAFGPWQPSESFNQTNVNQFTELTGDPNPIHREGGGAPYFSGPIVPGMMLLAASNRLVPGGIQGLFPGQLIVLKQVKNFKPIRPVLIGQEVQLRYRIAAVGADLGGPFITVKFEMRSVSPTKTVATSTIDFYIKRSED